MKKTTKLRRSVLERNLQQHHGRIEALQKNKDNLIEQQNFTSNQSDNLNLQRQVEGIDEIIKQELEAHERVEKQLEELELLQVQTFGSKATSRELSARETLLGILSPYERKIWTLLEQAFIFCRITGWEGRPPSTLKVLMLELEDMQPDENNILPLIKFAAVLISREDLPMELYQLVTDWGKQIIADFTVVQKQVKQQLEFQSAAKEQSQSYLFIIVENSLITSDEYLVEARIIPDSQSYDSTTGEGSALLNNILSDRETYTVSDLEVLVEEYLEQCKSYRLKHLAIEVFLPLPLINEAVDSWKRRQEYGLPRIRIGCDYSIVVRSSERLKHYGYRDEWEQKWNTLATLNEQTCDFCVEGDLDLETLLYELGRPEAVVLKLVKAPEQVGTGSVFAALLKTATPIALWIRRNLPIPSYQTSELNSLLKCCIKELPAQVKEKRRETLKPENKEDSHIGHHLALLWEDPYRLPPSTIEYAPPGL